MGAGFILVSPPGLEPIDVDEAKAFLRVEIEDDDDLIESLITTARKHVEDYCGRSLINTEWDMWMDRFPGNSMNTPWWDGVREGPVSLITAPSARKFPILKGPIQAGTVTIKTYDLEDTETLVPASDYIVNDSLEIPEISLRSGAVWPVNLREAKAIRISMTCGYGGSGTQVPRPILTAMKQLITHWYENRESVIQGTSASEIPLSTKVLLDSYQLVRV